MHGQNTFPRKDEIHHRENRFFDFPSVTGSADDDFTCGIVDDDEAF